MVHGGIEGILVQDEIGVGIGTVRSIKKVTVTDKSYQLNRKTLTFSKNLDPKTVNFFEEALPENR